MFLTNCIRDDSTSLSLSKRSELVNKCVFISYIVTPRSTPFQVNEAELATTALFLSLGGIGVSLINGRSEEVAYVTLSSSTALWEVEMRSKWKTLNVELASWLEEQWSKDVSNVTLEDVMQVGTVNSIHACYGALQS